LEDILARASRVADDAEVFMASSEETPVEFEANHLKHIQSKQTRTVALRIVKDGRVGHATTTHTDKGDELVEDALATARFGTEARFQLPSQQSYPPVEVYDPTTTAVTLEQMVQVGQKLVDTIRRHCPEIVCEAGVARTTATVTIINSRGGQAGYRESVFSVGIEGQVIRGTDMLFVGEHQSSCHPLLDPEPISRAVIRQLDLARERASVRTKAMPVVFTPTGFASAFCRPLMAAFSGKTVLERASPVGERLGQKVFDSKLSLRDDPTIAYCPGSGPCDDEAVPSQCTPLITEGTVTAFLYDLQTAGLAGTASTGNGHRSQGGLPAPAPTVFSVSPGDASFEHMVADMKEGLVVERLMGATQGNILGGDFSGNVLLGFKVENGRIVGRVKDTMVSGNVYRLLDDVAAIGSDTKWVGGFLSTPSVYCSRVSVAAR